MSSPVITSYDPQRLPAIKKELFISSGLFADLHLAYFEDHDHVMFALKSAEASRREDVSSLEKEKRIYESLKGCPGITRYFMDATTVDPDDGLTYYSLMIDTNFGTLHDIILFKKGCVPEPHVKAFARNILAGLCSLHSRGYVHCDLKPANIVSFPSFADPGNPYELKLSDFELAEEPQFKLPSACWKGRYVGTPEYMSPESFKDGVISWRLDIWSFGCVMLQMLKGSVEPWRTTLVEDTCYNNFEELLKDPDFDPLATKFGALLTSPDFDPLATVPESTSETGKSFLRACLDKDPLKRWSARQLLGHPYLAVTASMGPVRQRPDVVNELIESLVNHESKKSVTGVM